MDSVINMRNNFILKANNNSFTNKEYLSSTYIFIPIKESFYDNVKLNNKLFKGEFISKSCYTTVSGTIKGSKNCYNLNNKVKCLAIENNYKEQRSKKKIFDESLINEDVLKKLKSQKDNIIYNAFTDEPLVYNDQVIISKYYQELLNTLDYIKKTYNFKKIYIIIKDIDKKNIEKFMNVIGNYPEIKFLTIPNIYPIINTNYYEEALNINNYITFTTSEIFNIYYLKEHRNCACERYLTISKDDRRSIVVKVKNGTLVSEILDYLKINVKDFDIYLNGLIGGTKIESITDLIVTDKLNAIFLTKNKLKEQSKCINCGNCVKFCPMKINPKYIYDHETMPSKYKNKCIKCGLCNYICPVYIRLKEDIERKENETA